MRPEPFTALESVAWGIFIRLGPYRLLGGMGDLGPLPWAAVQSELDQWGDGMSHRRLLERLVLATDAAYRRESARMSSQGARSGRRRAH